MTENEFKNLIQKHLKKHGLEKYPVKMTNAFRTLGSLRHRKGIIEEFRFSRHLIKANGGVPENTILHEIAHALDVINRGTSDHGYHWQKICCEIGADPVATVHKPYDDSIYRYEIVCDSCKKMVAHRHTMTSRTKRRFNRSWCSNCGTGSNLIIIDTQKIKIDIKPIENISGTFKISELAKMMGICPKKARRNLRAANIDHLKIGKSWVFATEHENLIKEIISR